MLSTLKLSHRDDYYKNINNTSPINRQTKKMQNMNRKSWNSLNKKPSHDILSTEICGQPQEPMMLLIRNNKSHFKRKKYRLIENF